MCIRDSFTALPKGYPEIPFLKKIYRIGGLSASFVTFLTPVLTLVLVYLLILLINHTKIGMAMRAVSKDYETASLMGIKINKTITFTFEMCIRDRGMWGPLNWEAISQNSFAR